MVNRQILLILFTIAMALLSIPSTDTGVAVAEEVCANGTHWDDGLKRCV